MESNDDIDEIADRMAIRQLRHQYCHFVDSNRYDEWAELFTEDGVLDVDGRDPFEGRDAVRQFGREVLDPAYDHSAHMVSNPLITVDGDYGTGQWYLYLMYTLSNGNAGWRQGRYDEEYRNVNGDWKFVRIEASFFAEQERATL